MRIVLSVSGGDEVLGLESLNDWLRREPDLRGQVGWVRDKPDPTHLGDPSQALTVAVGAGGALTALATSLHAWLAQPRRASLKVMIHNKGGRVVDLDFEGKNKHIPDVLALLRENLREDRDDPE